MHRITICTKFILENHRESILVRESLSQRIAVCTEFILENHRESILVRESLSHRINFPIESKTVEPKYLKRGNLSGPKREKWLFPRHFDRPAFFSGFWQACYNPATRFSTHKARVSWDVPSTILFDHGLLGLCPMSISVGLCSPQRAARTIVVDFQRVRTANLSKFTVTALVKTQKLKTLPLKGKKNKVTVWQVLLRNQ